MKMAKKLDGIFSISFATWCVFHYLAQRKKKKSNHPHLKQYQGLLAAVAGLEVLEWGILVPGICPGVGCNG